MLGAFIEFARLTQLTLQPEAVRKPVVSTIPGKPRAVLGVPGLFSAAAHLADVRERGLRRLPHGSRFDVYEPSTVVNLGLLNAQSFGIPKALFPFMDTDFRDREVRGVMDDIDRLADEGAPVTVYGHSLGGLIALEAWTRLREPHRVSRLITAGSPHQFSMFGFPDRPDTGTFNTLGGIHDIVVSSTLAWHEKEDNNSEVAAGHFGFLVGKNGVNAVVDELVYSSPSNLAIAS